MGKLTETFKNFFDRTPPKPQMDIEPAIKAGSRKSFDTEVSPIIPPRFGLLPPFPLQQYLTLYETCSLARAIVDVNVKLTLSPIEVVGGDAELEKFVTDFNERIYLPEVLRQLATDVEIYGFALAEIVGDGQRLIDSTKIIRLDRIDPRSVLIQKSPKSLFQFFRQIPSLSNQVVGFPNADVLLDPTSIVYLTNYSPRTVYGISTYQSSLDLFSYRADIIEAAAIAAESHANPTKLATYRTSETKTETNAEVAAKIDALVKATDDIEASKTPWLCAAGHGEFEFNTIGVESLPQIEAILNHISATIIAASGLQPQMMGFQFGKGGQVQGSTSFRATISNIENKQKMISTALNKTLYKVLPLIEKTPPGEIKVNMQSPTLESANELWTGKNTQWNVVSQMAKAGILSAEQLAKEMGQDAIADQDLFDEWLMADTQVNNDNDPAQSINASKKGLSPKTNNISGQSFRRAS